MFSPQITPTDDLKKSQMYLYIIFGIGLFLAFSKFVGAPSIALNELLQNGLLLCGSMCLNYCMVVFYVILALFNTLMICQIIGIQIQQYVILGANKLSTGNSKDIFLYTIFSITIVFNIISVIVCYYAYIKFKKGFNSQRAGGNNLSTPLQKSQAKKNEKKDFEAFKGDGIKIGD